MKILKDLFSVARDVKTFLAFFGVTGITFVQYKEEFLYYLYTYQVQYAIMLLVVVYYIVVSKNNMNCNIKELSVKVEDLSHQQRVRDLKTKVLSAYKEYGNKTIDDKLVADYLMDLEKDRAELKVNSFTQGQLTKMISNIDFDKIIEI